MLFHLTMTHSEENCPAYDSGTMAKLAELELKRDDLTKDIGIKVHYMVSAAPGHVFYALVETDSVTSIALFTNAFPSRQSFQVTPVISLADLIKAGESMRR